MRVIKPKSPLPFAASAGNNMTCHLVDASGNTIAVLTTLDSADRDYMVAAANLLPECCDQINECNLLLHAYGMADHPVAKNCAEMLRKLGMLEGGDAAHGTEVG
jgi:hypothetical protein